MGPILKVESGYFLWALPFGWFPCLDSLNAPPPEFPPYPPCPTHARLQGLDMALDSIDILWFIRYSLRKSGQLAVRNETISLLFCYVFWII